MRRLTRSIVSHRPLLLLSLLIAAAGCDTSLQAENPYDPDIPESQKEPATLVGQVSLENGEPTAATVELRPAGRYATPDSQGVFEIAGITPGTYTVRVSAAGHSAFTQGGVYCATGQRVDLGQIGLLAARGAIQGTARLELAPDTAADSHGGVLVFAHPLVEGRRAAGESAQGTVTGPDGEWTMTGLPVGTYQLSGSKDGYAPSPPLEVTVTADETTPVSEMVLRSITGVIRIDEGAAFTNQTDGQVTVTVLAFETDEMQISEDPEFGDAAWEQHTAERSWTLSEGDGEKTVYMRFRNGDIYQTPAVFDTIVLDRGAPTDPAVAIAGGAEFVTDPQVALRLAADDALSGVAEMRIAVDGDITDETWDRFVSQRIVELDVPDDPDGVTATVQAQFRDTAGNPSDVVSDEVVVDAVAPQNATLQIAYGAARTASRDVLLSLAADGAHEMQVSNDAGLAGATWQPFASTLAWRLSETDEQKTVYARFRDGAGNQSDIVQDGIELNTRGSISGAFRLEGAAASGNADITVALGTTPPTTTVTAQDGSFGFSDVAVGVYSLTASQDGYRAVSLPYLEVQPGEATDLGAHTLEALRGGLRGVARREDAVADEHGGIVVEVLGAGKSTVTNAAGEWLVEDLLVGQYSVRATAEGYLEASRSGVGVGADAITAVGTLVLTPNPGSIAGRVTLEGVAAPGLDIAEVLVAGQTVPCAGDGSFEVQGVRAGTYSLLARAAGFGSVEKLVTVAPGQQSALDPIALSVARGDLTGQAELEGRSDHSGILVAVQGTAFSAVTAETGEWTIRGVPVGQYAIRASAAGFNPAVTPDIDVVAGETTPVPLLALTTNPGSVAGRVTLEGQATDAFDGVQLELEGTGLTAQSASNGDFAFPAVPSGAYSLTASKAGFSKVQRVVTVAAGAQTDVARINLLIARGAIEGTATLVAQDDHSGITVEVDGTGYAGITSGDGNFRINAVPVGTYTLTARKKEYLTRTTSSPVQVEEGKTTVVDLGELGRQQGDFSIEERASGDKEYLNDAAVTLDFSQLPPDPAEIWIAEDEGFGSGAWESFDTGGTTHDYDLLSADGTVTVYVKFRDLGGQESPVFNASAVLDREAPLASSSVEIDAGADFARGMDVSLALVGQDATSGVSQMCLSITGACDPTADRPFQASFSPFRLVDPPPGADGERTVSVWFVDRAGNRSAAPATDTIYLDRAPPANPSLLVNAGAAFATDPLVTLILGAEDACTPEYPGGGCAGGVVEPAQMMISNTLGFTGAQWEPFAHTRAWFLEPGDGDKTVYAKFRDGAGNASSADSDTITLDRMAPSGTVAVQGGAYTSTVDINLVLTGPGDVQGVCVYGDVSGPCDPDSDPTGWPAFASPLAAKLTTGDGAKAVRARLSDTAGNRSGEMTAGTILDTVDPVATTPVVGDGGGYVTSTDGITSLDIRCSDFESGVASESYRIDGGSWQTPTLASSYVIDLGSVEGSVLVETQCADRAGRQSGVTGTTVLWDKTAPTVAATIQGPDFTNDPVLSVQVTGNDGTGSGLLAVAIRDASFDCDIALYQEITSGDTLSLPVTGDGVKTAHVCAMDVAGNRTGASAPSTNSVTVDTLEPGAGTLTLAGGDELVNSTTASLSVTGGDNSLLVTLWGDLNTGAGTYWYGPDQDGAGGYAVLPADVTLADANGLNVVSALFTDQADNDSNSFSALITVDTTPPDDGTVTLAGGQDPVDNQTIAVTIEDTAPDTMRFWGMDPIAACGNPVCDGGGFVPFVPATSHTFLDSDPELKRVCWKFCDEAGNGSNVGFQDITLATVDERPTPELDTIEPLSYTALSREYLSSPPDPLYPLTLTGLGISADTKAEVGDFLLDCVPQGTPDGSACKADAGGGCGTGGDCEATCATSCVVSLPPEIMKYSGTYVVRLVTPAPVEGSGTSSNTEFFTVVAPRPEVSRIWPRGVVQLFDAGGEAIAEDVTVEIEGRNWMNNVLFRLGGNYGTAQSLTTDPDTGEQKAVVQVSTAGQYESALGTTYQPTIVQLAAVNSGTGGGEDGRDFGLNPRIASMTDISWSLEVPPVLLPTEISASPNSRVRRVTMPRTKLLTGVHWTGENEWAGSSDQNGQPTTRIARTTSPGVAPMPWSAQWADLESAVGTAPTAGLREDSVWGWHYWGGDGSFGPSDCVYMGGSNSYNRGTVADVNRDGLPDLIKVDSDNNRISIRLNAGMAGFGPEQFITTGEGTGKVAVSDLDGDSVPDLVIGRSGTASVRLGKGDGTFGNQLDMAMNEYAGHPVLGDINRDGAADIVMLRSIRLGNGNGTFGPYDYMLGLHSPAAIGDLNGDGFPDVVATYGDSIHVTLATGFGRFQSSVSYSSGAGNIGDAALADANGDGVLDVYALDYGTDALVLYHGAGDGSFSVQGTYPAVAPANGVAAGDLDGDRIPDVAVADAEVSLYFGQADGSLVAGAPLSVTCGGSTWNIEIVDMDADGTPDVVVEGGGFWAIFDGNGSSNIPGPIAKSAWNPQCIGVADIDRDGNVDVIAAETNDPAGIGIYTGHGDGTLDDVSWVGHQYDIRVVVSDLDGDGDADLVSGDTNSSDVMVSLNNGDGTYAAAVPYATLDEVGTIVVGDVNGDGIPDIFTGVWTAFQTDMSMLLGVGDGTFQAVQGIPTGDRGEWPWLMDTNNDGFLDLGARNRVMLGNGDGSFQPAVATNGFSPDAIADLDGDGNLDLVNGGIQVNLGNGDGTFQSGETYYAGEISRGVSLADVDGDGNLDAFSANEDDHNYSLLMGNGDGSFGPATPLMGCEDAYGTAAADFDNDGAPDLVGFCRTGNQLIVQPMGIPGSWSQSLRELPLVTEVAPDGEISTTSVHQGGQLLEKIAVTVLLEWADEPTTGSVTLSLTAPDGLTTIPLATESSFTEWNDSWWDSWDILGWRLDATYREGETTGDLTALHGVQPTGDWTLNIDNGTDQPARIVEFTVHTRGQLTAPRLGTSEDRPEPIPLAPGTSGRVIPGTLFGFPDTVDVSCAQAADGGRDHYYEIDLLTANTLSVAVDGTFDALVAIGQGACDSFTPLACDDTSWWNQKPKITDQAVAAGPVCIIVSGDQRDGNQHHGPYDLFLHFGTPIP